MVVEAVSYSLATGINRGLVLLALPFLGKRLTIEEFGLWSLTQIIVSLGAPVVSLNGAAGILREGIGNPPLGFSVFRYFNKVTALISMLAIIIVSLVKVDWLFYAILLVVIEGFASMISIWYRSRDQHQLYFSVVFSKLSALVFAILIVGEPADLTGILFYQTFFGALFLLPFFIHVYFFEKIQRINFDRKAVLIFCAALIPHGLSQWIMSSSDRIIIKSFLGDSELGQYSVTYTLALCLMLLNSGLGMSVGVDVVKNYKLWTTTNRRSRGIVLYSVAFTLVSIALVAFVVQFKPHLTFLNGLRMESLTLLPWILNGMYFMGIYLFYINYLNYLRESVLLSSITIGAAIVNVLITLSLIQSWGIHGAAVSAFISYLALMAASMIFSIKKAELAKESYMRDVAVVVVTATIIYVAVLWILPG